MHGDARLSDAECLALVLGTGRSGRTAEQIGTDLIRRFGGLGRLALAEIREMAEVPGVGIARACALRGAFGLGRRVVESLLQPGVRVASGGDVARFVRESARREGKEAFFSLLLDVRHRVLGLRVVSVGGLDGAPVHPREVFRPAIREGAAAVIVAHNHPSGDPGPSTCDRMVTERLEQVGELVGIRVLDHVVVGSSRYYSLAENRSFAIPSATPGS